MKDLRIIIILILIFSSFGMHALAFSSNSTEKRVIITYKNSKSLEQFSTKAANKINRRFKRILAATATLSTYDIEKLKKDPNVISIEEDKKISIKSQTTNWGLGDIHSANAWNNGLTGKGVKIGVIDTGIDRSHQDLQIQGGASFVDYTADYNDDNGHGTHVAGIIGAKDNNFGVKGVAPDVNLFAIKVMDSLGEGYTSSFIAGIDWAISNKMDIINISAGSSNDSSALKNAIDQAYQQGILVVAAGGNEGNNNPVDFPAQYDSAIAVSAVDNSNSLAKFSSTGEKIEIAAPGVNILSTCMNNTYCIESGTSMATPFASGFLALLKEANPLSTNIELRNLLDITTIDLGASGKDSSFGYGLISFPMEKKIEAPLSFNAIPTDTNVNLTWSTLQGASSYTLKRNGQPVYIGKSISFLDTNVTSGTWYNYSIYANSSYSIGLETQISVLTKISNPIILKTVTPIFNNLDDVYPIAFLSSQTVNSFDSTGNWREIHTWLGDKWIQLSDYPVITFIENTPMYDSTGTTGKVAGYIAPQSVQTIGSYDNLFLIHTWLGEKWVSGKHAIIGEMSNNPISIRFDETTKLYQGPFSDLEVSGYIAPQILTAFETWNGWFRIHTWLGDKWVSGEHAIMGDVSQVNIYLLFDKNTPLYDSPYTNALIGGYIAPQTILAFEKWNDWYHVHTWLGDKWIPGQNAILK